MSIEVDSMPLELLNAPSMEWNDEPSLGEVGNLAMGDAQFVGVVVGAFVLSCVLDVALGYFVKRTFFCHR